jgi:hypothetical protein
MTQAQRFNNVKANAIVVTKEIEWNIAVVAEVSVTAPLISLSGDGLPLGMSLGLSLGSSLGKALGVSLGASLGLVLGVTLKIESIGWSLFIPSKIGAVVGRFVAIGATLSVGVIADTGATIGSSLVVIVTSALGLFTGVFVSSSIRWFISWHDVYAMHPSVIKITINFIVL